MKGVGAVAAPSLRDELLGLPGVAEVELDGEGSAPSGVRIRLAPDADPDRVGLEVQRVLAAYGMRSRVDGTAVAPPPLPPLPPLAPREEEAPPPAPVEARPAPGLAAVRLEETASTLEVTVTAADGRQATRSSAVGEDELAAAVIEAVGELLVGGPPRVIAVDWATANGSRVVTVVLEAPGGARGAGAGLVRASRPYAIARAAWAALTD
ncbi:MAG: hypothetical protein JW785_09265 [Acidimicrobiia bacterium]|nr:hypothetical protein [Acidimicrobiia bacterium]